MGTSRTRSPHGCAKDCFPTSPSATLPAPAHSESGLRVGVLADPHGDAAATAFALALLRRARSDLMICLGDVVSEHRFSEETCRLLIEARVRCVRGNHDRRWADPVDPDAVGPGADGETRRWHARLPERLELRLAGRRVVACHGSPASATEYLLPGTAALAREAAIGDAVLLTGHTHMPMCERVEATLVVNPGSCSETRAPRSRDVLTVATIDLPQGAVTLHGFRRAPAGAGFVAVDGPLGFDAFAWPSRAPA